MMTRVVFIDAIGIVRQIVVGYLTPAELAQLLADYRVLFSATDFVIVASNVPVWIGGSYDSTSGEFSPPPPPEPEPIAVDAPIEEIVEETTNDDAPIE